jgi:hypothetical protein
MFRKILNFLINKKNDKKIGSADLYPKSIDLSDQSICHALSHSDLCKSIINIYRQILTRIITKKIINTNNEYMVRYNPSVYGLDCSSFGRTIIDLVQKSFYGIGMKYIDQDQDQDDSLMFTIDQTDPTIIFLTDFLANVRNDQPMINNNLLYIKEHEVLLIADNVEMINRGTIFVDANAIIIIKGKLFNNGCLINLGGIFIGDNQNRGWLYNSGVMLNQNMIYTMLCTKTYESSKYNYLNHNTDQTDQIIQPSDFLNNNQLIMKTYTSALFNDHLLYNMPDGVITNDSYFINSDQSYIKNNGHIQNGGHFNNCGELYNKHHGVFENGVMYNYGSVINKGMVSPDVMTNHQDVQNLISGTIVSTLIENYGNMDNHGVVHSDHIDMNGGITNRGNILSLAFKCCGYVHNLKNMHIKYLTVMGKLLNDGTIDILKNGHLENFGICQNNNTISSECITDHLFIIQ